MQSVSGSRRLSYFNDPTIDKPEQVSEGEFKGICTKMKKGITPENALKPSVHTQLHITALSPLNPEYLSVMRSLEELQIKIKSQWEEKRLFYQQTWKISPSESKRTNERVIKINELWLHEEMSKAGLTIRQRNRVVLAYLELRELNNQLALCVNFLEIGNSMRDDSAVGIASRP